jgi:hypothetical protein
MTMLTPEILAYVGVSTATEFACDPVEQGAVRRYAQAIMDDDPDYGPDAPASTPWGGPIAPPLFPNHAHRRAFGTPGIVQLRANDPDFDGTGGQAGGLPPIEPLKHFAVLNGGAEFELYRYARQGERVQVTQRYADITEKVSSKGSMILVIVEAEIRTAENELLLRARRTLIRRPA